MALDISCYNVGVSKKVDFLLLIAIVLLIAGAIILSVTRPPVKIIRISFPLEGKGTGDAILFVPHGLSPYDTRGRPPVVFLLPGIISLSERYRGMAGELARNGYASLAVYFPGSDAKVNRKVVQASARCLEQKHPEVDSGMRAYMGHSLGGTTAVDVSYFDVNSYAAISIGYYIGGELAGSPKNVLLGTGIYDDLNDVEKMRASMKSVTDGATDREGIQVGDFSKRTARELFVSPTSNHASETEDPYVVQRIIKWLNLSFYGKSKDSLPCVFQYRAACALMIFAGLFILLSYAGIMLQVKNPAVMRMTWFAAILLCALSIFIIKRAAGIYGLTLFFFSGLASTYYSARADTGIPGFRRGFMHMMLGIFLFALTFSLSQLIFNINIYAADSSYIWSLPKYIYYAFVVTFLSYLDSITVFVTSYHPFIMLLFFALGLAILAYDQNKKGIVLGGLNSWMERVGRFFTYKAAKEVPLKEKLMLAALLVILILTWLWVYKTGLLNTEVMLPYAKFIGQYLVFPIVTWLIVYRKIEAMILG